MPKRAKRLWRKNIQLDDLYEGIQRTRAELAQGGIIREKSDAELFTINENREDVITTPTEPSRKRRRPLNVDEILGIRESTLSVPIHNPSKKEHQAEAETKKSVVPKKPDDVWNVLQEDPIPKDIPPPATLLYAKSVPAVPPSTIRSRRRMLRAETKVPAVTVPSKGQSYNPAFEDWAELINETAAKEQKRLNEVARKEWVPDPEAEHPALEPVPNEETEEEAEMVENFLGKSVQVRRKTRTQRNKQRRILEQVRHRKLMQKEKSKDKQVEKLQEILSEISTTCAPTSKVKKPKELAVAPLEVQLSNELTESLRLLKSEGNLFRDRYRSLVERGIVEPRFSASKRGRKYPLKYVEKYDYKHWRA